MQCWLFVNLDARPSSRTFINLQHGILYLDVKDLFVRTFPLPSVSVGQDSAFDRSRRARMLGLNDELLDIGHFIPLIMQLTCPFGFHLFLKQIVSGRGYCEEHRKGQNLVFKGQSTMPSV